MAAKAWKCLDCGHIVVAGEDPTPMDWSDAHTCAFVEHKEYFNFKDLVVPPPTDGVIFYRGKGDDDD